ncbi:aldo/keto reductase [Vagococcus vulneris]|uniref:2,5-diketo-D-gluconic acid reductase n=1 Tax=Vagococcus vulneris TaxID=1977869 RepID=A0A430A2C6_9ENTE|nr:aldo/keto reductase [Vagococcus vulneris]RSU00590.1 2,5-diketo-D-gluconic acid reductase [Vagococcus vulneris]
MIFDENFQLNNGILIPKLGLGTWLIPEDKAAFAVESAVKIGYRLIDTAQAYDSRFEVAQGIRNCGIDREQLFITSKVSANAKTFESAKQSISDILTEMDLDYIDLMLIHSPQPWDEFRGDKRYFKENINVWRALEEAYKEGKVRAIGVSNFLIDDLENIIENCNIVPMVNQVLCHISNTPMDVINFCQSNNILVESYSPIAHGETLKDPLIKEMADKYHVSVPQLCIRYDLQLNTVVLPKTGNPEHMKDNAAVDFIISDGDMEKLKHIKKLDSYGDSAKFPVYNGK